MSDFFGFVFSIGSEYILNFEDIWLVEARFWEMNGVVNDILVLKMVAKIVFVQNHKFEILNPNPKPQSQILNPNQNPISRSQTPNPMLAVGRSRCPLSIVYWIVSIGLISVDKRSILVLKTSNPNLKS